MAPGFGRGSNPTLCMGSDASPQHFPRLGGSQGQRTEMTNHPNRRKGNARPIEWHEQCLLNMQVNLAAYERELVNKQANIDRLKTYMELTAKQIERAKREGKTRFDGERFKV